MDGAGRWQFMRVTDGSIFFSMLRSEQGQDVYAESRQACRTLKKTDKIVDVKYKAIKYELSRDKFDYLHFFPTRSKAQLFKKQSTILFSEWFETWLGEKSLRHNTEKGWNSAYNQHLGPALGHLPLSQITDSTVAVFRKYLEKKGLAASSINDKIIKVLCMSLFTACQKGIISTYPCKTLKRLTEQPAEIDPLSFDELRHFLDYLKQHKLKYYDMFLLWSQTGLRPGEMYALKWSNVDYFNSKLMIRETRHQNGTEGPPKTATSNRDIDLTLPASRHWGVRKPAQLLQTGIFSRPRPVSLGVRPLCVRSFGIYSGSPV